MVQQWTEELNRVYGLCSRPKKHHQQGSLCDFHTQHTMLCYLVPAIPLGPPAFYLACYCRYQKIGLNSWKEPNLVVQGVINSTASIPDASSCGDNFYIPFLRGVGLVPVNAFNISGISGLNSWKDPNLVVHGVYNSTWPTKFPMPDSNKLWVFSQMVHNLSP